MSWGVLGGSSTLPVTCMGSKTHENHYEGLQIWHTIASGLKNTFCKNHYQIFSSTPRHPPLPYLGSRLAFPVPPCFRYLFPINLILTAQQKSGSFSFCVEHVIYPVHTLMVQCSWPSKAVTAFWSLWDKDCNHKHTPKVTVSWAMLPPSATLSMYMCNRLTTRHESHQMRRALEWTFNAS